MRTDLNENAPKHLIIENPITGKEINILPILQMGSENFSGFNSGNDSVYQNLDDAIKLLSTSEIESGLISDIRYIVYKLYQLRDAFGSITEFSTSKHLHHGE